MYKKNIFKNIDFTTVTLFIYYYLFYIIFLLLLEIMIICNY